MNKLVKLLQSNFYLLLFEKLDLRWKILKKNELENNDNNLKNDAYGTEIKGIE